MVLELVRREQSTPLAVGCQAIIPLLWTDHC